MSDNKENNTPAPALRRPSTLMTVEDDLFSTDDQLDWMEVRLEQTQERLDRLCNKHDELLDATKRYVNECQKAFKGLTRENLYLKNRIDGLTAMILTRGMFGSSAPKGIKKRRRRGL